MSTTMAGELNQLMGLWNEWATQILVLLSLTLQLVLNVLAGIRRREMTRTTAVKRFLLWLAYQLADSTAIYTVGQLSLSGVPREHKLVAFWAPFLLLHLGGPDNITAYALEDNKLWKRHALTLAVQVLGVVYVLYMYIALNGRLIVLAAALMFLVGTAKYAERTFALWSANFSSIQNSLKVVPRHKRQHFYIRYEHPHEPHHQGPDQGVDDELLLQRAHSLFHVCKRGIVDSVIDGDDDPENPDTRAIQDLFPGEKYPDGDPSTVTVMQMELSLMYDILYTKANVIHNYLGYGIRTMAPLAVVTSLLLFHFSGKGGHNRVDVPITYVLLGGALILETKSLLSSLGSSWALAFLCATRWSWLRHVALCSGRWYRLRRALLSLRRPAMISVTLGSSRKGTLTMRQYSMMLSCARRVNTTGGLFNDWFTYLGWSDWLDKKHCSWNTPVPEMVMTALQKMLKEILRRWDLNTMGLRRRQWGQHAMSDKNNRAELFENIKPYHGVDFHESVLIWHIATEMFLTTRELDGLPIVEAIRALSNYLMFLFVDRPDMLPGLPQNWLYQQTMINMVKSCKGRNGFIKESSRLKQIKQVAGILLPKDQEQAKSGPKVPRLNYARVVAEKLTEWEKDDPVDVLLDLWIDFLIYAANRCNRESHAKRLNNGCEFLTVVWLMVEHYSVLENADKESRT
ncbi:hypothetical protein GUJ93_ZPchr0004g39047 [Zizania palustris]|uniref:DUF4220 domain-containing protein n=1 Tax=Zizania palustris TaxID=103762 RepID=A0A8J5SA41_ZIZPA|nr:hypothetical protein GUJ93_ZPchr0004g39047 [Zizania palustris]